LAESLTAKIPEGVRRRATFDAAQVAAAFEVRTRELLAADEETQWRIGVHGKRAFHGLLVPALIAERDPRKRPMELASSLNGRPAPLDDLVAMLFP